MKLQDVYAYHNLPFLAQKAMEGFITGNHNSPLHGFSVEFAEHRPYNPGESIRNLDWKLLAKTEKRYIKQYIEETNLRCHFWIDISDSMRFPEKKELKLKYALLAASSMGHLLHRQRDAFRFSLYNETALVWESDLKSTRTHLHHCIHAFSPYWEGQATPNTEIPFAYTDLLKGVTRRNMVVLLSDFLFDPNKNRETEFWETLSYLHYLKCEVLLLHITDHPQERNLQMGDQPVKFVDLETGSHIKLHPNEYADAYFASEQLRISALKDRCNGMGLRYYDCDVAQDLKQVLNHFYVERARLI